jgi:hypothetical protein
MNPEANLASRIVDHLVTGDIDFFLAHEREWNNSKLAIEMRAPKGQPKVIDAAFTDQVWAKWNRSSHRS